jgi:tetratricopeptide (TPR) repeat protein
METVSIEDLQGEITHLRNKMDSIAEENQAAKKPWFKNISTFISVAAFLFSFGTTIVSYKRANDQDIHNLRSELRGILQRLTALQKENAEMTQKFSSDPNTVALLSGEIKQENTLLSKQSNEIIKRLPQDQVSAIDYLSVAQALFASRDFNDAIADSKNALAIASTLDDEVDALRSLAIFETRTGKTGDARSHFQQALDLFEKKYHGYDDYTKNYTNFVTEISWFSAEANGRDMEAATQHVNGAEQYLRNMPPGPETEIFKGQITQARNRLNVLGQAVPTNPLPAATLGQVPALTPEMGVLKLAPAGTNKTLIPVTSSKRNKRGSA